MQETSSRYERKNNPSVIDADLPYENNPTVLWAYLSGYHNTWDVDDFPGKYYCNYANMCSTDTLEQPDGVVYVKDKYYDTA